jgi:hypothetical protein
LKDRRQTHQRAICEQLDAVPLADVCHSMEWPEVDERKLSGGRGKGGGSGRFGNQGRGIKRRLEWKLPHLYLIGEDNTVTKSRADFFHTQ